MPALHELTDDALIGCLQRGAFNYFSRYTNAENGLEWDPPAALRWWGSPSPAIP